MYKIYHNPMWSKSRESVKILENSGLTFEVIEYLKTGLTVKALKENVNTLNLNINDIIRKKNSLYKELKLDNVSEKKLYVILSENIKLMERPIIIKGKIGVIGRPPIKIKDLF